MTSTQPRLNRQTRTVAVTSEQVERYQLREHLREGWLRIFAGAVQVDESWLEVPIGDGWIAAYRLSHGTRGSRITEVRVFQDDGTERPAGESNMNLQPSRRLRAPFLFERLRRGITERSFDSALAATRENAARQGALAAFGNPASRAARSAKEGRGAGRPGRNRRFYAEAAVRFDRIEWSRGDGNASTYREMQKRYYPKASVAAIAKWISRAGAMGFVTAAERGERGRRATLLARKIAGSAA
jgi:hypothetical protein